MSIIFQRNKERKTYQLSLLTFKTSITKDKRLNFRKTSVKVLKSMMIQFYQTMLYKSKFKVKSLTNLAKVKMTAMHLTPISLLININRNLWSKLLKKGKLLNLLIKKLRESMLLEVKRILQYSQVTILQSNLNFKYFKNQTNSFLRMCQVTYRDRLSAILLQY